MYLGILVQIRFGTNWTLGNQLVDTKVSERPETKTEQRAIMTNGNSNGNDKESLALTKGRVHLIRIGKIVCSKIEVRPEDLWNSILVEKGPRRNKWPFQQRRPTDPVRLRRTNSLSQADGRETARTRMVVRLHPGDQQTILQTQQSVGLYDIFRKVLL